MVQWRRLFGTHGKYVNTVAENWVEAHANFGQSVRIDLNGEMKHDTVSPATISLPQFHTNFPSTVLPTYTDEDVASAIPPADVTKIALRLKYLVEEIVPCELPEDDIVLPHSKIITKAVVKTASSAGGGDHDACVVYCLLVNKRWFKRQAKCELWDADLHELRATACEVIAKQMYVPNKRDGWARYADCGLVSKMRRISRICSRTSCLRDTQFLLTEARRTPRTSLSELSTYTHLKLLDHLDIRSASIISGEDGLFRTRMTQVHSSIMATNPTQTTGHTFIQIVCEHQCIKMPLRSSYQLSISASLLELSTLSIPRVIWISLKYCFTSSPLGSSVMNSRSCGRLAGIISVSGMFSISPYMPSWRPAWLSGSWH